MLFNVTQFVLGAFVQTKHGVKQIFNSVYWIFVELELVWREREVKKPLGIQHQTVVVIWVFTYPNTHTLTHITIEYTPMS